MLVFGMLIIVVQLVGIAAAKVLLVEGLLGVVLLVLVLGLVVLLFVLLLVVNGIAGCDTGIAS